MPTSQIDETIDYLPPLFITTLSILKQDNVKKLQICNNKNVIEYNFNWFFVQVSVLRHLLQFSNFLTQVSNNSIFTVITHL